MVMGFPIMGMFIRMLVHVIVMMIPVIMMMIAMFVVMVVRTISASAGGTHIFSFLFE
jgi:hypothetical protein